MVKIGEFIYPWGSGHYSRMMRLNSVLPDYVEELEIHYSSKDHVLKKLLEQFPDQKDKIHEILMPTPIDGEFGPSISRSLFNFLVPLDNNPPLVQQIASYLKQEAILYQKEKFDLVINDGDVGSNAIAKNQGVPSIFITNQFRPHLLTSRIYFYPSLFYLTKQMSKATKIVVADSPPPYTMCEYNLNFPNYVKDKVEYVGHFTNGKSLDKKTKSKLELLIENEKFGYWMRTGNKSTNDGTGKRYNEIFRQDYMKNEKRIISHARDNPSIDRVVDKDGKIYSIEEALDKKVDWLQIDVGFLTEQEKDTVLNLCEYAVVNGSHTVMGEILGGKKKPILGIPVYDEHVNQIKWAQEKGIGMLADNTKQAIDGIKKIKQDYDIFLDNLEDFSAHFVRNGAQNAAKIVQEIIENKK
ncbi:MAG: glycosyltransferase [Nitrosopumilaceae archaeon]|nr:glycosyltransferase [Nitrosopumilaceae archaeon]NIU01902.1 glycosyltransferase [Nitrosopumilaceae archaeon]NIU88306.1 glycosyltransferase [Nitrosopumilaceae archaeon]NIV66598.1 glycosyltransferase [Nitrosopumilaceae archaeon]NIX62503.1 glycosyltransferase [Nitrosopumilaceae archaeon]